MGSGDDSWNVMKCDNCGKTDYKCHPLIYYSAEVLKHLEYPTTGWKEGFLYKTREIQKTVNYGSIRQHSVKVCERCMTEWEAVPSLAILGSICFAAGISLILYRTNPRLGLFLFFPICLVIGWALYKAFKYSKFVRDLACKLWPFHMRYTMEPHGVREHFVKKSQEAVLKLLRNDKVQYIQFLDPKEHAKLLQKLR